MRDHAEVEKAIGHLRQALRSPLADETFRYLAGMQIELLEWTAGKENSFSELMGEMEAVDADERASRQ